MSTFILNHRSTITIDGMGIGTGHGLYIRQATEESQGIVLVFFIAEISIGYDNALRIVSQVFVQDIVVLQHHHIHQSADESYAGKLHE